MKTNDDQSYLHTRSTYDPKLAGRKGVSTSFGRGDQLDTNQVEVLLKDKDFDNKTYLPLHNSLSRGRLDVDEVYVAASSGRAEGSGRQITRARDLRVFTAGSLTARTPSLATNPEVSIKMSAQSEWSKYSMRVYSASASIPYVYTCL